MTVLESVIMKLSIFLVCAVLFTACTTTGGTSTTATTSQQKTEPRTPSAFERY